METCVQSLKYELQQLSILFCFFREQNQFAELFGNVLNAAFCFIKFDENW